MMDANESERLEAARAACAVLAAVHDQGLYRHIPLEVARTVCRLAGSDGEGWESAGPSVVQGAAHRIAQKRAHTYMADLLAERDALAAWACTSCGARFPQAVRPWELDGVTRCSRCVEVEQLRNVLVQARADLVVLREAVEPVVRLVGSVGRYPRLDDSSPLAVSGEVEVGQARRALAALEYTVKRREA